MTVVTGVAWTMGHYLSVHFYERVCAPLSLMGFFMSPLLIDTPQCTALRWTLQNSAYMIRESWRYLATVCVVTSVSSGMMSKWRETHHDGGR